MYVYIYNLMNLYMLTPCFKTGSVLQPGFLKCEWLKYWWIVRVADKRG